MNIMVVNDCNEKNICNFRLKKKTAILGRIVVLSTYLKGFIA